MQESVARILELLADEEKSVLNLLINPESSGEFVVNDCNEIDSETYENLKRCYRLLFAWRNNEQNNIKKILSDMLLVEHQKLRGNFLWYCFQVKDPVLNGEECCKFGMHTYWTRRALLEVAIEVNDKEISDYKKKMFDSYHNVCVYLYKAGKIQTACILEHEVIEESMKILSPIKSFNAKAQNRINNIMNVIRQNNELKQKNMQNRIIEQDAEQENEEKLKYGIFEYLWEKKCGYSEESNELKHHNTVLEEMQYMGDYYLHMGYYAVALRQFSHITLSRYIRFDIADNKTMDSFLRLYVTAVACGEQKMCRLLTDCAKGKLLQHSDREEWKDTAKGLASKVNCLEALIAITNEGGENVIDEMLRILDCGQEM